MSEELDRLCMGGQGRSGSDVADSAWLICLALILAALFIFSAFAGGLVQQYRSRSAATTPNLAKSEVRSRNAEGRQ